MITKRICRRALLILMVTVMAGCSSQASRMATCRAQGISPDACYISEQNRNAAILNAAEAQALRNAQNVTKH